MGLFSHSTVFHRTERQERARCTLREERYQEIYEEERLRINAEIALGILPSPPPKTWGELFSDNYIYVLDKAHNLGSAYITVNTACVSAGMLATAAIYATKKSACVVACASQTVAAVVAANPVAVGIGIGVGGTMLIGYTVHKNRQINQPIAIEVNVNNIINDNVHVEMLRKNTPM